MADKTTESSVEFSLNQLMEIEADRARSEEAARSAQAEADARSAAELELRAREAEEARIAAEEQRRRDEDARKREESARLAAIHAAEVEKARLEAENAARLEQLKAAQHHEREKLAISENEEKKRLKKLTVQISLALIGVALAGGGVAYKIHAAKQASEARLAEELRQAQAQVASFERKLRDQEAVVEHTKSALLAAKDEAERAALQSALDKARAEVDKTKQSIKEATPRGAKGGGAKGGGNKAVCNCQPGDPLCSCL